MASAKTGKREDSLSNGSEEITIQDVRRAIPAHLFERSESTFMVSVLQSCAMAYVLYQLATYIPQTWVCLPLWLGYFFLQGTVCTGIWVLGHECGHGAFSAKTWLNDVLGYTLHTALLVPYYSWQWSHHVHHSKCNHLTQGETHVPLPEGHPKTQFYTKVKEIIGTESFAIWQTLNILFIGWPAYLIAGVTGGPARGFTSHFFVPNDLFPRSKLLKVHASNFGLLIVGYLLFKWVQATSFANVFCLYLGPYLVVNAYLTMITFLQHTEDDVPHYDEKAWNWFKGALATVDRNWPGWIDHLQYHIGTTHVVHHLFHELPHYNAVEANVHAKKILANLYNSDKKNVAKAMLDAAKLTHVKHIGNGVWKYV